ncbi:cell division protein FtsL [Staphylococcus epidermidis]|uniref:cell division protein FtsL n=1 Tax=Staphylococcus epidermidis TaxID=1282 RepID=UPI00188927B2|nr:cell division protein FtsL [Staphylococcus epidermidis]MBF2202253.1 cell division protein FtsL [Staphylococcus epidermidis]
MAVEKIYQPYDEATQTSIPRRQPQSNPEKQTVKRKVVVQLTRFEKILYIALITVIALISIYMLSLKMDAYDTRGKIADLDQKIEKQSSENSALKSEIKKNSSYERIYDKAKKQGMSLENDNVKVVRNNGEAKN